MSYVTPAAPPPLPPAAGSEKESSRHVGTIVGVTIALVAMVALAIVSALWLRRQRQRRAAARPPLTEPLGPGGMAP